MATYSGSCGTNLTWRLDDSTGVLNISGTGTMKSYSQSSSAPWYSRRASIKAVVVEDGVTSIGNYAFYGLELVESIIIPDSVTSIGLYAFVRCHSINSINISNNVTYIGTAPFHDCNLLTEIIVDADNANFSSDENGVLFNKDKTTLIQYPAGNVRKSYVIPDGVKNIGIYSFCGCTSLTSVTIPDSVTSIGNAAFQNCTSLTSVTIPGRVTSISGTTFYGCTSLISVAIPDSVTSIGMSAFYNCTSLKDVYYSGSEEELNAISIDTNNSPLKNATIHFNYVPNDILTSGTCGENLTWTLDDGTLTISGTGAMTDYWSTNAPWDSNKQLIKKIIIEDGVTSIGYLAFSSCTSLVEITIPDSVTSIGGWALSSCSSLTNVHIPDSVTSIGEGAFAYCSLLNEVDISDSITSIVGYTFYQCYSLTSIIIPESVTSIETSSFFSCTSLDTIIIYDNVTSISDYAFYNCTSLTDAYYTGTEEEWDAISVGSNNSSLLNATIHYNYVDCEHTWNETITIEPTCINKGLKTFTCTVCGESYTEEMDALGHAHESVVTSPTCTDSGYTTHTCSRCGDTYTSDYIPALGHIDENDDGYCDRESCGVPFCDHIGKDAVLKGAHSATCTEDGYTGDKHCGICDEIIEYGVVIPALGHNTIHTTAKNATCSTSGNYEYWYCNVCNTYFKDAACTISTTIDALTIPINPNAHMWDEGVITTQPTIEQNGVKTYTCSLCGKTKTEIIDKLVDIASGVCGANLTWVINAYGTLTISGTGDMYYFEDDFEVPWRSYSASIKEVIIEDGATNICDGAFSYCSSLTSVTIPDSVTGIGYNAFYGCKSLTSVTIPDSVTSIGSSVFYNCTSLTEITVDIDNINYSSDEYGVLFNKDKTTLIQYPIGNERTSYTIPDSVTSIGYAAFEDCASLTSIFIPDSVTSIGIAAFSNCTSLTSVNIPDGVTSIGNSAFRDCAALTSVIIPDSVTSLGVYVFGYCTSLTSVTIPETVTSIGNYAFYDCTSLTDVYFKGSILNWSKISIGTGNDDLRFANIHYIIAVGSCGDNLTWILNRYGTLTISGTGAMSDFSNSNLAPWHDYSSSITTINILPGVTTIGNCAFSDCPSLTKATIPKSVKSIGDSAFESCSSLTDVYYGGLKKDWDLISIKNNNEPLLNAKIYLSNGGNSNIIDCGICGEDLVWTLYVGGTFVISGTGRMTDYDSLYSVPWHQYREKSDDDDESYIKIISIENGITSISEHAFVRCRDAISVSLPKSITSIGEYAFDSCTGLEAVYVSNLESWCNIDFGGVQSNPAYFRGNLYFGYELATQITIPNTITEINEYTFAGCVNLTSVIIPDCVTNIGSMAFAYCESLQSVAIPNSVTNIGNGAFQECEWLENVYYGGTEEEWKDIVIGDNNEPLLKANIHFVSNIFGDGLTWSFDTSNYTLYISGIGTMEDYQSYTNVPWVKHIPNIVNINISPGIRNIGDRAFCHCEKLTTVSFGDNSTVISIGKYAFYQCTAMTGFNVPASVKNISDTAFYECSSLATISVNSENSFYCSIRGILYTKDNKTLVHYPGGKPEETFTIPSGVEKIGNYAFAANKKLTTVTISSGVTSIGYAAFKDCTKLTNITIPASVQTIGIISFINCTTLKKITFSSGSTVMSIGHGAFSYCTALTSVNLEACGQLKEIRYYTFRGCSSLNYKNISLPSGIKVGYQAFYGCINAT